MGNAAREHPPQFNVGIGRSPDTGRQGRSSWAVNSDLQDGYLPPPLCIELSKQCDTKHNEDNVYGTLLMELPSRINVSIPCSDATKNLCGVWNLTRWIDEDSRVQWSLEQCESAGADCWVHYRDSNREYVMFLQPRPHGEVVEYRSFPGSAPHNGELRVFRVGPDNGFPHDLRLTVTRP